jgi:Uma2 family endonuclease
MALPNRVRFKATDIFDTPDDGKRYEVIDGDLYVSPPPVPEHQGAAVVLTGYLQPFIRDRNLGRLYTAPIGVTLDDENGVQPDLVFISRERLDIVGRRGIEGAPDLVVEVLSPSTRSRDRGVKQRRYAAAGVRYYWIVDPRTRTLDELRLGGEGYERIGTSGPGAVFRPELFPGLEISIDELWA